MTKKSFFMALLVGMAVLGAEAQTNKVYKADTVIYGNGNKIITVYSQGTFAEGNGNVMDYNISGWGSIYYYGDVKVKGTNWNGRIKRIDSENKKPKEKCCHEKP